MHPTCRQPDPGLPPGGFHILQTDVLDNGYVSIEASDAYGRIVSTVLPFRQTTPGGVDAGLLDSWRQLSSARFDACAALWSWEQEGLEQDALDDADTGLLPT